VMPQAIERLLATPSTTPRFPAINEPLPAITLPAPFAVCGGFIMRRLSTRKA
jgi:hypothetical protein